MPDRLAAAYFIGDFFARK